MRQTNLNIFNRFPFSDKPPPWTTFWCGPPPPQTHTHTHKVCHFMMKLLFWLLWWAASRPVKTCWVTLDVESTPASLRHRSVCTGGLHLQLVTHMHVHMRAHTHTTALFLQTCNPDKTWKAVRPPDSLILLCFWCYRSLSPPALVRTCMCVCVSLYLSPKTHFSNTHYIVSTKSSLWGPKPGPH